jgi:two-component system, OmpR family, sensor histidine kinase VanS
LSVRGKHPANGAQPEVVDLGVIHDLLNPLTSIVGNLDLLDELLAGAALPAAQRRLSDGLASAEELRSMLENLRYLMAGDSCGPVPHAPLELPRMLEQLQQRVQQRGLVKHPIELRLPAEPVPPVPGVEDLLRRAADVLLRTAARIGTRITVELECAAGSEIEVRFVHQGRTLPAILAGRLLEPDFSQVQSQQGVKIDRGRGLWFARSVIEAHQGSLRYEPGGDGGSFIARLPAERDPNR